MRRFIAILLAALLTLCFTGCKDAADNSTPTEYVPTSTIDPASVDFGYNEEKDTYDRWYLQGTDDVTYAYFSYDNIESLDNYVCTYNLVKSGVVTESTSLCLSSDNHLVPNATSSISIDLVFEDYFNAYDYISGNRYSRGNAQEYNAYFNNKVYTGENELYAIAFNSDFTCTKSDKENATNGTWEVTSPYTVVCTFDSKEISYSINYYDDYSVRSIVNKDEILYPEASQEETQNKYKAY